MASIATFLQAELVNLSNEARKKYPDIKEAAERLITLVRQSKDKSNAEVCEDLARSEDTLRPFVLALETKTTRLISSAMGCLQRLILHHALIDNADAMRSLLRALGDIASLSSDVQLRVLQIILPLLSNYNCIHDDMLADAVVVCFRLQQSKDVLVSNTASATLRQLVIFLFDKLVKEDEAFQSSSLSDLSRSLAPAPQTVDALRPCAKDSYMLFQDLCLLTSNEAPQFLRLQHLQRTYGLELIESILANHAAVFARHPQFTALLKNKVCPLVIKTFSEKHDFPQTMRLMRVIHVIVKHFSASLIMECEVFLSMLLKTAEPDNPQWQRVIAMEIFKSMCGDPALLRSIYRHYDQQKHTTDVFHDLINVINRLAAEKPLAAATGAGGAMHSISENSTHSSSTSESNTLQSDSAMRIPCMEQLDKSDPPHVPDLYLSLLSLQCLILLVDGLHSDVFKAQEVVKRKQSDGAESALKSPDVQVFEANECLATARDMVDSSWHGLLAALSLFVMASTDEELSGAVVRALQHVTVTCGVLDMITPRDAFITTICKHALPGLGERLPTATADKAAAGGALAANGGQADTTALGIITNLPALTERNFACLAVLINVAEALAESLRDAWLSVFETLHLAEHLIANKSSRGAGAHPPKKLASQQSIPVMASPPKTDLSLMGKKQSQATTAVGSGQMTTSALAEAEANFLKSSKLFFEQSKQLSDDPFLAFIKALCVMSSDPSNSGSSNAVNASSDDDKARGIQGIMAKLSTRLDEKTFAVDRLREVALSNLPRIIVQNEQAWLAIVGQLIDVATLSANPQPLRQAACDTVTEIVYQGTTQTDAKQFESSRDLQVKLLHPLRDLVSLPLASGAVGLSLDVPRRALETLDKMLQQQGQAFALTWGLIFDIVKRVCMVSAPRIVSDSDSVGLETQSRHNLQTMSAAITTSSAPSSPQIGTATISPAVASPPRLGGLVRVAFPCLQLICTDYPSLLGADTLKQCIDALCAFAAQNDDLNVSLTAVRMLWNLSDFLQMRLQELSKGGSQEPAPPASPSEVQTSLTSLTSLDGVNDLWLGLLRQLLTVCGDPRPEVRNGAVQSLLRAIANHGDILTQEMWLACIRQIMFALLDLIRTAASQAALVSPPPQATAPSTAAPRLHHSRDTAEKQWDETKVTALSGVVKVFHDFLPRLIHLPDFGGIWGILLSNIKEYCVCGSNEVALVAVKCLKMLLSTRTRLSESPNDDDRDKMKALWRVLWGVWEHIGLSLVPQNAGSGLPTCDLSHDALTHFTQAVADIYAVLQPEFTVEEHRRLLAVLAAVFQNGARAKEYPHDADYLAALQVALLDATLLLDQNIAGTPALLICRLAEYIVLPIDRAASMLPPPTSGSKKTVYPTYLALSRRSVRTALEVFQSHVALLDVYSSGAFDTLNDALGRIMVLKYDCPAPGKSDSGSLWKSATTSFLAVVTAGLSQVEKHVDAIPREAVDAIYANVVKVLQGHILSKSMPPQSTPLDDMEVDEQFDISTVQTIQADLVQHLCRAHVADEIPETLVATIERASRYREQSIVSSLADGAAAESLSRQDEAPSPSPSTGLGLYNKDVLSSPAGRSSISVPDHTSTAPGSPDSIVVDMPVMREKFPAACLDVLFAFAEPAVDAKDTARLRKLAVATLLKRSKDVVAAYSNDKPMQGRMPFLRIRDEEMLAILQRLLDLRLAPNTLSAFGTGRQPTPITEHLLQLPNAHLFYLYPELCRCLAACGGLGSDENQNQITRLLVKCLELCGQDLGV
ncbi:Endocytosis and vacuole integrity protein [Sorochytrium milnesiophthora]